jgi:uncharacterized membrane protein
VRAPDWVKRNPRKAERLGSRILEALREIGMLLMAFGPLDIALSEKGLANRWGFLLLFVGGGLVLFVLALIVEWRRNDAAD